MQAPHSTVKHICRVTSLREAAQPEPSDPVQSAEFESEVDSVLGRWDQLLSALWEGVSSGTMVVICTGQGDTAYTRYLQVRCWARCRYHLLRAACGCVLYEGLRFRCGDYQVQAVCTAASSLGFFALCWLVSPACGPARPPPISSAETADVPAEVVPTLCLATAGAKVPAAAAARRHACLDPRLRGVAGVEECTGSLRGLLCCGQIMVKQESWNYI